MIYLKHINGKVAFTHFMPFDEKEGLGKSEEELKKEGILVESIPEPEQREGFASILNVNPEDNSLFYTYEEVPMSQEEQYKAEIDGLKVSQLQQDEILMDLMLGGV
ncbi:hypothetical protein NCCP2716_27930 [Sporosarcina sp. NCCP-2716]|uniref:hypothetical protein n=1 Tax=Sporosarcina sp. NCCP-2716 TaxID=2943679 RepID=UPI00203EF5A5|nr:hypothetical protein [Sporosarcina sp. NCCP-2716]GKV70295.1 hypothetical protein NCCP2716_27930 [Sporosarcina sp. NCCP-2716]